MCEVVRPGAVRAGDEVQVLSRPDHGLTVGLAFEARYPPNVAAAFLASRPAADIHPDVLAKARASLR